MSHIITAAFYQFVALPDFAQLREPLMACCEENSIKGTILLAPEGINGTIAGHVAQVHAVLAFIRSDVRLANLEHKEAIAKKMPFYRMKIRLKKEIVHLGVAGVNPSKMAGTYVKPADWNALIDDPNVVMVDVRNDYEVAIGSFPGALNPQTKTFAELPAWLEQQSTLKEKPKIAMFCTGGIRCEKSTALLRAQGFNNVFHLQGGILKYLEVVPARDNRWQGECFVFDERVAVGPGLKHGNFEFCRSCRYPLGPQDRESPLFVRGVSCAHCHASLSEERKRSLAERQKQVELAEGRNELHVGAQFPRVGK
jgi:UPF0176 protein